MNEIEEMKRLAGVMDDILPEEERRKLGWIQEEKNERIFERAKQVIEADMMQSTQFSPLVNKVDQRTLFPVQGKYSDGESIFIFEYSDDARDLYDFITKTDLLKPGEVNLHISEHQNSVHIQPHVLATKPSIFQAILIAYDEYVMEGEENEEAYESLVQEVDEILTERVKVSGAPKGKKGNPFHDKKTGKFSGAQSIKGNKGGSFAIGKTKLKFAKASKNKKGDTVVQFASTKRPCGREARRKGKDIRCWDGEKGKGFPEGIELASIIKKYLQSEHISDDDLKKMIGAVDRINESAKAVGYNIEESVKVGSNVMAKKGFDDYFRKMVSQGWGEHANEMWKNATQALKKKLVGKVTEVGHKPGYPVTVKFEGQKRVVVIPPKYLIIREAVEETKLSGLIKELSENKS